ncbi:Ede1p [Sugiyamaella lignohabitans]|uniref:Ede1p n=1 Tax=Sugiyamaella lignohabitans TaxID=796027 RepID=A0A167FKB8_9ASCO|nr:Ede1p [Sugiyamaella lignohabitans]ANB15411.1 Ede1p [Sugiyamaella lignohabitans]
MSFSNSSSFTGQRKRINLSPDEKKLYAQLFKQCDPEGLGIVTGDVARTLLERSGLSSDLLGEIWQRADVENNGFLDQIGFSLALRLIGSVQAGYPLTATSGDQAVQLPVFDGRSRPDPVSPPASSAPPPVQAPAQGPQLARLGAPQPTGTPTGTRIPVLNPADRQRFIQLFQRNAPNGYLDGEAAKAIFTKANLPNDTLGQIWTLADSQSRGSLDQNEFIIAMHLIQSIRTGSLARVPTSVPSGLIESIARPSSNNSFRSASGQPQPQAQTIRLVQPQYTGGSVSSGVDRQSPIIRGPPSDWTISSQEKARYDGLFDSLDKQNTGRIGADEVVPFLKMSKLSEDTLAQVWDLADIQNTGVFSKTEFAVAMYLVQQKLAGRELPSTLPPSVLASLTPGGSRQSSYASTFPGQPYAPGQQPQQRQVSTASQQTVIIGGNAQSGTPSVPPPNRSTATSSAMDDLVSLNDVFASPSPTLSRQGTLPQSPNTDTAPKQFVPSSSFGQSLATELPAATTGPSGHAFSNHVSGPTASHTGTQGPLLAANSSTAQPTRDLLADDDPQVSALSSATTEFANLSNQISSLTTQTRNTTEKREQSEKELSNLLAQKKDIEAKLAVLRANYDSEVQRVQQVQELLNTSRTETAKVTQDHSVVEASLQALQSRFQQLSGEHEQDRQQYAALKEKLRVCNEQTAYLKSTLEELEKENKQQKMRNNVAQQQVAVAEEQNKKLSDEINALKEHNASLEASTRAAEAAAAAANESVAQKRQELSQLSTAVPATATSRLVHPGTDSQQRGLGNPFSSHFSGSQLAGAAAGAVTATVATGASSFFQNESNNSEFDESFRQLEIASPSTAEPARSSTHNTEETPGSSPPTSDYQVYNQQEGENIGIPSFTLPLARPLSATSSVQNNPPMSVRDDLDVSRPETPTESTTEPVSGIVPPEPLEDLKDSKFDQGLRALDDGTHASDIAVTSEFGQGDQQDPYKEEIAASPSVPTTSGVSTVDGLRNVEDGNPTSSAEVGGVGEKDSSLETLRSRDTPSQFTETAVGDLPSSSAAENSPSNADQQQEIESQPPVVEPQDTVIALSTNNVIDREANAVTEPSGSAVIASTASDDHHESSESFEFVDAEDQEDKSTLHSKSVASTLPHAPPTSFPTSSTTFAKPGSNPEFPPIQDLQQDEDSSSDDEDENIGHHQARGSDGENLDKFVTPESTGDNTHTFGPAAAVASSEVVPADPPAYNEFNFKQDSSAISTHASGSTVVNDASTSLAPAVEPPTPLTVSAPGGFPEQSVAKSVGGFEDDDPFATAFSGLSEAKEDKGDTTEDFTNNDEFQHTFDEAFSESNNFGVSTFGTASQSSAGGPGSGSGSGSDEWEQLFAGFSNNVPPPTVPNASEQDINDAFAIPSGATPFAASVAAPPLPPKAVSPNSAAVNELVGMGFTHEDALDALQKKNFNLSEASNYLLDRTR